MADLLHRDDAITVHGRIFVVSKLDIHRCKVFLFVSSAFFFFSDSMHNILFYNILSKVVICARMFGQPPKTFPNYIRQDICNLCSEWK